MEMRMHDKYIITNTLPVNGKQMVLGVHSEEGRKLATWEVCNDEFLWAHYFTNQQDAVKDLCERTLQEISLMNRRDKRVENDYTVTAIVKNGNDTAVIEFPTRELPDILGSIGIREPADKVCLGGQYYIEITPGSGKMADALNHIFQKGDSLHLVNEVARAVYHADFRVYDMVEEKLKYGQFPSAEQLLNEAGKLAEQIKKQDKKTVR